MSLTSWFLVSSGGTRHRLPREMIFVGRDDCELMLQSRSVDKQHAVINYEATSDQHKVKDLGSLNGTFVNDVRIQEQMYFTLKMDDKLRLHTNLFSVVRGELQVPEEALKHEKFSSQLQLNKKPSGEDSPKTAKSPVTTPPESKAVEEASEGPTKPADAPPGEEKIPGDIGLLHRGTPLYGQPSWWGDDDADDENSFKQETKSSKKKAREDRQHGVPAVTIKDHVSKCTPDPRAHPRKSSLQGGAGLSTLQAAIMASESKVADWLAQNEPALTHGEGGPSNVVTQLRRLRGSKHADGTQSDSENGAGLRPADGKPAVEERPRAGPSRPGQGVAKSREGAGPVSRKAFMIEFFDEANPRKRRSYSFSQTVPLMGEGPSPAPPSRRTPGDCAKGVVSLGVASALAAVAPTAARLLLKQRSEDPSGSSLGPSITGQNTAPFDQPRTGSCQKEKDHEDDQSDKGTYTIELEKPHHEEEEARRMIDKVFGVEGSREHNTTGRPEHLQEEAKARQTSGTGETKVPGGGASEILPEGSASADSSRWVSQWASLASNHMRTDPEGSGGEASAFSQEKEAEASDLRQSGPCNSSHPEHRRRALPQLPSDRKPQLGRSPHGIGEKQDTESQEKESQKGRPPRPAMGTQAKQTPAKASEPRVRAPGSAEKLAKDGASQAEEKKPLVRQGSFTVEKPSAHVPQELIPRIPQGSAPLPRQRSDSSGSLDTAALLRDTEAVMAFLEARLRDGSEPDPSESTARLPPGKDVAGTSSLAVRDAERKSAPKRRTLSSLHKEKMAAVPSSTTRDNLDRRARTRPSESRESRRPALPSHRSRQPSLDLTDDDVTSSLPHSAFSSDQETSSARSLGRGQLTSNDDILHSKLESGKSQLTLAGGPGKPGSGLRPRPTRTSLLRRARLGDTSDTDLADADRASGRLEVSTTSSTSKQLSGRKGLSRIDMLAQPRRTRQGPMSARKSDFREATPGRLSAETALRLGLRAGSAADTKPATRLRANSVTKLPDAKAKPPPSMPHASPAPSRWRRLPPEYASTSEDEFGSNLSSHKPGRVRPGSTLRGARLGGSVPSTPGSSGAAALRHQRLKQQEEYVRDWTSHSEEIARSYPCVNRISQDLAKDLAILAREIHDVAGEIDSVGSSGTVPSTPASTAATTPGSAIDTREELVDRVFDESLNFRKIPPIVLTKAPEINGRPTDLRPQAPSSRESQAALRRRTWTREEAVLDSLLLTSVSQLSVKIRQSVDKTAGKIRMFFKDKERNWDEIENKLQSESDIPLLKTSNKVISSIFLELKRVEKQLEVIDVMVDPDGTLDVLTGPTLPKCKTSSSPLGPLPVCDPAPGPLSSTPVGGTERDPCLRPPCVRPSGEESPITSK
ncbi:hypothetical protein GJAV_G00238520 [Gymnothorax javanicus]|nr:hypothetical protein GJAV_G00238520 [Gymnothorax javanicus]